MKKYLLANLKTGAVYIERLFKTRAEVEKLREDALATYGITTDYEVCEVAPVINRKGK